MAPTLVQFTPLSSQTHPSFWNKLTQLKLDVLKLSDAEVPVTGSYSVGRHVKDREQGVVIGVDGCLSVEEGSFESDVPHGAMTVHASGVLKNYNTIEEFKAADKQALFAKCADQIWESIVSTRSPAKLNDFLLITYADLKKYKYFYWFAFPAFTSSPAWHISETGWQPASSSLSPDHLASIHKQLSERTSSFFFLQQDKVLSIEEYKGEADVTIGFIDPSTQPENPGWPLRNLLTYLRALYPQSARTVTVLSWRDSEAPREGDDWKSRVGLLSLGDGATEPQAALQSKPSAVGWEKNPQGKLGPRMADLAPMMDPTRLAGQAVSLNLKLMRWRILPSLDLETIADTKCLLLGAGTLGCYVARGLMAWGIQTITFVDSARVSFSNPVRQPLFKFEDCLNGGKPKAECAAERLKEIWPGVNATGYSMSIPMPGHPIPASPPSVMDQTKKDVAKLEELIAAHDVVYLLMDSRESRWLPSVIGRIKGKLIINAALGFDTFLVMRHGARPKPGFEESEDKYAGQNLGCYYCNDIVAPADSLSDRTLDQMCTVTRPGLASIASSTAVELMTSLLQHKDGLYAPAPAPLPPNELQHQEGAAGTSVLGLIPHQLRGYLAQFRNMLIVGRRYERCTGCSETVLNAYESEGFDFLVKAFEDPKYLEKLTGLDKLFEEGQKALDDMEALDIEDEGDDF